MQTMTTTINKRSFWRSLAALMGVAVLLLSLFSATAAQATTGSSSTTPDFVTKWGSDGSADGQFGVIYDLAVDSSGNVYVADLNNQRIQKFDSNGNFLSKWGSFGSGDGQFKSLYGVAVDSSGNVYVVDTYNYRIQKFSSDGTFIDKWGSFGSANGQFNTPRSVAVDGSGNVYVADTGSHSIQKFDSNGNFLSKWGTNGSADGQFDGPFGIAIDSNGNVYVADTFNDRIQKFSSDGTFIDKWGTSGSANGQLDSPRGIVVDSSGNIYVADTDNHRIQKFSSDGTFIDKWGTNGSANGQFDRPGSIAIDSRGNIYVADTFNRRIQKFSYSQNLASLTSPSASGIELVLPEGSHITDHQVITAPVDEGYSYPLGLVDFTFNSTTNGATVPIELIFATGLKPADVTPRKYNATTQSYAAIPGATVTETTLDGKPALILSYAVTDGGTLDADGVANGVIVDPVGLGVVTAGSTDSNGSLAGDTTAPGAPNTGLKSTEMGIFVAAIAVGVGLLIGLVAPIRRKVYGIFKEMA